MIFQCSISTRIYYVLLIFEVYLVVLLEYVFLLEVFSSTTLL